MTDAAQPATALEALIGCYCHVARLGRAPALAATIKLGRACILVKAIVAANNDATATGHCTKGSGADTMVLPRNSKQI